MRSGPWRHGRCQWRPAPRVRRPLADRRIPLDCASKRASGRSGGVGRWGSGRRVDPVSSRTDHSRSDGSWMPRLIETARDVKEDLQQPAREALDSVKATAQDAARTTADSGRQATDSFKADTADHSRHRPWRRTDGRPTQDQRAPRVRSSAAGWAGSGSPRTRGREGWRPRPLSGIDVTVPRPAAIMRVPG